MFLSFIRFIEKYKLPLLAGGLLLWEVFKAVKVARGVTFASKLEHVCTHPECAQLRQSLSGRFGDVWDTIRSTAERNAPPPEPADNPPS
jgi:hypothetical protein